MKVSIKLKTLEKVFPYICVIAILGLMIFTIIIN